MAKTGAFDYNALLLSIYRASRELPLTEFQDAALELVKSAIQFDSSRWATGTMHADGLIFNTVHLHKDSPDTILDYQAVKAEDTIAFTVLDDKGLTFNAHSPTLFRGIKKSGIRDFTRRHQHQNALVTATQLPENSAWHAISLYRANPDQHYSERERSLCQVLVPHLMEAYLANAVHFGQYVSKDDCGPRRHLAICDRSGILYHQEPGFIALVQAEWHGWKSFQLPLALRTAFLQEDQKTFIGKSMVVAGTIVKEMVFLKARAKLSADNLTAREREIARRIAEGHSHKEIAILLNIAPSTVRNHIQAMHERLNVRSNAELAAQLKIAGI